MDDPYGTASGLTALLPLPAVLFALLLLFVLGALFALCAAAVDTASESRMKRDAENGVKPAADFLAYREKHETCAEALQLGMLVSGFLSAGVTAAGLSPLLAQALRCCGLLPPWAPLLALAACVLLNAALFVTLSDFVPKKIIRHRAVRGTAPPYGLLGLLRVLNALMRPMLAVCSAASGGVLRLFHYDPQLLRDTVTEEEILHMVGEGEERGVIEETERDMITNILDFNDTTVSEIMTHRTDICAVRGDMPLTDVAALAAKEGFSRLPVFDEDIDSIIGICYVKDFLPYIGRDVPELTRLADMVRPAYFIPETKKCSQLFTELTERKVQIAVIVDEYGGTAGLITLEDLIESIVGNIQDEYDNEEEDILRVSENEFTVDGTTPIDEISDLTGTALPEGDYDTIAGLVTECLGRIPKEDERPVVTIKNLTITVLKVEDQRLSKLSILKNPPEAPRPDDEEN